MIVFPDTSVIVPSLLESHPHHGRALPWFRKALSGEIDLRLSGHSIAETYSVLTRIPVSPRIPPGTANQLINENLLRNFKVIDLTHKDYSHAIQWASQKGLSGGIIYDILIAMAFKRSKADTFLTFNLRDFSRIFSDTPEVVVSP